MESTPELQTGEETEQVSSTESPPENVVEEIEYENAEEEISEPTGPLDKEEFENRVTRLMAMMKEDSTVRDRILAETYVNIASAEMGIRGVMEAMQSGGIAGMMKGAFRRG